MAKKKSRVPAVIRNVVETPWKQYPGHFGGALSKPLVRPETAGSRLVDSLGGESQPIGDDGTVTVGIDGYGARWFRVVTEGARRLV